MFRYPHIQKKESKNLLEMVLLTAEVMELKANPNRKQQEVLLSKLSWIKEKDPVATVLVQKGTLHVGDAIAAGSAHGKSPCNDGR